MNLLKSSMYLPVGALLLAGCSLSVNSDIDVPDGETRTGGLTSVNGRVSIGRDCTIEGGSKAVNGRIEVGDRSKVEDLGTVNGRIETGDGVVVSGDVESVNGSIELGNGSSVSGRVTTVNGSIAMAKTEIGGDVKSVNGNIRLLDGSVVKGDIVIDRKGSSGNRTDPIEIEVAGGSLVEGNVIVRQAKVEVHLILRGGGKVLGRVDGAKLIDENEPVAP